MTTSFEKTTIIQRIRIRPESKLAFIDWQAKLNAVITAFSGFVSLEILSPSEMTQFNWVIIQRFYNAEDVAVWRKSKERQQLMDKLKDFVAADIQEVKSEASHLKEGVTEVFVTQVNPHQEQAYRNWIAKIHQAEAKFPGFRGVYVQSPSHAQSQNWITLLQFDSPENLDLWLTSEERQKILEESKPLITSLESHRVISPYTGWFASVAKKGKTAPLWKQTLIILLVLFPIVMLELKFLSPLTASLNISLATFIGNAISVSLISWPMMPIAIWFLGWWLVPDATKRRQATIIGTIIVLVLYLIEIAIFWNLL